MRKHILILTMLCILFTQINVKAENNKYIRGAWVSTAYSIDYPKSPKPEEEYCFLLDDLKQRGVNTIIFQVRPAGDAFYNSKFVYKSKYAKDFADKDPLPFLIEETHKRGMEFHAWLNPYRVTVDSYKEQLSSFDKDLLVQYKGNYYLDPGNPESRKYIRNVVYELVHKYDIDAIHFDDYFYPGKDFNDAKTYKSYGKGLPLDQWRRNNVNTLVYNIHRLTKANKVSFGISPSGIWRNKSHDAKGSDTSGFSSYDDIYADSLYWVKHNLVDYIAPQIYWSTESTAANYKVVLDWWRNAVKGTNTKLYIGLGIYKPDILNQVKLQEDLASNTDGIIYFSAKDALKLSKKVTDVVIKSTNNKLYYFSYEE